MAELKDVRGAARSGAQEVRRSLGRVRRRATGGSALQKRVTALEAEVQECRQLNLRLAELTDVVEELLLPAAQRDEDRLAAALEKYSRGL